MYPGKNGEFVLIKLIIFLLKYGVCLMHIGKFKDFTESALLLTLQIMQTKLFFKTVCLWSSSSGGHNDIVSGETAELCVGRLAAGQGPLVLS